MEFYSQNGMIRPVRLCEETRKFAYESLNYKYGLETRKNRAVSLDDVENYEELTPLEQYDQAILKIVKDAPIRICDGELISGAATLGAAIGHRVPASYKGETNIKKISHLTIDFENVLNIGMSGIRKKAEESFELYKGTERERFMRSVLHCLDCFDIWHKRYLDALAGDPAYAANYKNLQNVPHNPPKSFYEAVQSVWFIFAFTRLCGNWPGIGRIDYLLGKYLEEDLKNNKITIDEAREILAHFFIKGCEWVCGYGYANGSGDAQHYQNIILAGVDENGKEITNTVTYLTLDVLEELGISDFPTTVRLNKETDEKLLRRIAEVMRFGGGILAVYNEDLILRALTDFGYPIEEARKFANDGCWEVQIPGKTNFSYYTIDALQVLQRFTLKNYVEEVDVKSYEELYDRYISDFRDAVHGMLGKLRERFEGYDEKEGRWRWLPQDPCTIISLFEIGCIERGLSYLEGGPIYSVASPHIGGLPDVANSLYAIKKLVYDDKVLTLPEFITVLKNNWEGEEVLRQSVLNKYSYYGNDNDEVDMIAAAVLNDFVDICAEMEGTCGYRFPCGVSTFGKQLKWVPRRLASPHGRKIGEILAGNTSPTPGTDKEGATAIIRSYCKNDLQRVPVGAGLDIKLLPSSVEGEDGLAAIVGLMRGFVELGGFFMQPDIVDASLLKEAQEHSEDYQTLSVRVSGWNARFVTLNKEWQDMVIEQNEK